MRLLLPIAASLILLTAPANARRDRAADKAMLTPIPGAKAESCIPITGIRTSRVRDDRTIDFYMRGKQIYRVTLPQACPQLGFEEAFSYATSLNQLCSTDIITVLNRGGGLMRGASCGLSEFVPVAETR